MHEYCISYDTLWRMGDKIYSALKNGNYKGIGKEISNFIVQSSPVKDAAWITKQNQYAVKFLYMCTSGLEKIDAEDVADVLQAMNDCCNFIQNNSHNPKDLSAAEKLLYHVLLKAVKSDHLSQSVSLAKCLVNFLAVDGRLVDANMQKIAMGGYKILWNVAIQIEKTDKPNAELCFDIRHQAIVLQLLSSVGTDRVQDIITWSIDHYASVVTKLKLDRDYGLKACQRVISMVSELSGIVTSRLGLALAPDDERLLLEIYIAMHMHLVLFLVVHDNSKMYTALAKPLHTFLLDRSTGKGEHSKDIGILNSLLPLLTSVLINLYHYTSISSAKISDNASRFSLSEAITSMKQADAQLRSIQTHTPLLINTLRLTVHLVLHIPEGLDATASKQIKYDIIKMPMMLQKAVLNLYEGAAMFFGAAVHTIGLSEKMVAHLHCSHVKLLRFRLQAVATKLEHVSDLKAESVCEQIPSLHLDLSRLDAALTARGNAAGSSGKTIADDMNALAGLAYRFSRIFYCQDMFSEAADFIQMCLDQFQRLSKYPSDVDPSNLKWMKRGEILAECQRRMGMPHLALSTISKVIDHEPGRLLNVADLWVRCKLEIAKQNPDNINTRTFWSYISEHNPISLDKLQVLNAELTTYKKFKTAPPILMLAVVEELVTATVVNPVAHASALLEKAALLWVGRTDGPITAEACCREATILLEGVLIDEKPAQCTTLSELARGYMFCHIISDVDPIKFLEQSKATKLTENPNGDIDEEDTEAYHDCCTLDMEHGAANMADRALEIWEQVAASENVLKLEKQQLAAMIDYISVLIDMYRLSHRVPEEYRALSLLMRLVNSADHPLVYLRVYTDMALLYTRLNQPHLSLELVDEFSHWLQTEDAKLCIGTIHHVHFYLASTEAHLQAGQVTLACEALGKATRMTNSNFKSNSTDTLKLLARIHRMAVTMQSLPPSYHGDGHPDCCLDNSMENAFELEHKSIKSISSVVSFMMGGWLLHRKPTVEKVPLNTLNKWALLDELITSLHSVGATCSRLGEAREARFYLQQGLKLAQGFHLPRRFAAFHLELSHFDSLSAHFTNSQSHMNVAFYTLNSADPIRPTESPPCVNKEQTGNDSEDEMTIKTMPIEMAEMLEEQDNPGKNLISSPTAHRWKPRAASCWSHDDDCECWQCADVQGHQLHLLHLAQQAYCLFQQGLHAQAEAFWNLLLQNFDAVTNRARHTVQKLMVNTPRHQGGGDADGGAGLKEQSFGLPGVNPSMFQRLLVTVCEQLTELAITQGNWELYEQWVSKASDLLDTDTYPWMIPCHASLAHTLYLQVLPNLPMPKVQEKTQIQELCDRMKFTKFSLDDETLLNAPEGHPLMVESPNEAIIESPDIPPKRSEKPLDSVELKPPNQRIRKTSQDSTIKFTTPRNKRVLTRKGSTDAITTSKTTLNSVLKFKTPKSVTKCRRDALDMLMNSDSEEDEIISKKKKIGSVQKKAPTARKTRQQNSNNDKTSMTSGSKLDLFSPSAGNRIKSNPVTTNLFKAGLNKCVELEVNSENVFDFVTSSPEENISARGKKKPAKPGRKAGTAHTRKEVKKPSNEPDIEVKRLVHHHTKSRQTVQPESVIGIQEHLTDITQKTNDIAQKANVTKKPSEVTQKKSSRASKGTSVKENLTEKPSARVTRVKTPMLKLTRSKTAVVETQRLSLGADESFISDNSICVSDDEEGIEILQESDTICTSDLVSEDCPFDQTEELHDKSSSSLITVSLPYEPSLEAVEEDTPFVIPDASLDDSIEICRGGTSVESKGKAPLLVRKTRSKRAEKVTATEVPRLSSSSPQLQTGDDLNTGNEAETACKLNNTISPPQCNVEALDRAFELLRHHPTPIPYRKVCQAKAIVELSHYTTVPWSAAFYLAEAHAISFRYRALSNISRKLRKLSEGPQGPEYGLEVARLNQLQKEMSFGKSMTDLQISMDGLPADWTVVQVSVVSTVGMPWGSLVISRFTAFEEPIIVKLPGFATTAGQKILEDFSTILQSNNTTMSVTNKSEWWAQRHGLNDKIKEALIDMESRWFGNWVGLLQGRPDNDLDESQLTMAAERLTKALNVVLDGQKGKTAKSASLNLVKLVLRSYHLLEDSRVMSLICEMFQLAVDEPLAAELMRKVRRAAKSLNLAASTSCRPVLLVLDNAVQHLPWESLPSVRGQPQTRLPSLHFLCGHYNALSLDPSSLLNTGVDLHKTFYVLNPDANLLNSQAAFEERFKAEAGWTGIIGKAPTSEEYAAGLASSDLFIYCGHGGGSRFLPCSQLATMRCHAVAVLMGCSSGKLVVDGQLEATGMMLSYFLAGCTSIAACLWDVTDRDIDRFLEEFLSRLKAESPTSSFLDCIQKSRDICRLDHLIGCAPAMYGLPVSVRKSNSQ